MEIVASITIGLADERAREEIERDLAQVLLGLPYVHLVVMDRPEHVLRLYPHGRPDGAEPAA